MRLDEACFDTFARHETFHPRWGWVRKAFVAADNFPKVFTSEDATLTLGVGKNMVRAIRFWGHAFRALAEQTDPDRPRMTTSHPSNVGDAIFGPDGWDPFTEDIGTLWLLHWLLLAPRSHVPVWWTAFAEFGAVEFSQAQLVDFVTDQVESVSAWPYPPHPSSIEKDVSCLLRTYASSTDTGRRQPFDDLVDCPMRELGLIRCVDPSARRFRFAIGPKPTLPAEVVLFACADFLARSDAQARTAVISRLANEPGAPGRVFKLSEAEMVAALELLAGDDGIVALARPTGAAQIVLNDEPASVADQALERYYRRRKLGKAPRRGPVAGPVADQVAARVHAGATS